MKRDDTCFEAEIAAATGNRPLDQQRGRLARLQRELATAFGMQPWPGALINRLVAEFAETEHAIASLESAP